MARDLPSHSNYEQRLGARPADEEQREEHASELDAAYENLAPQRVGEASYLEHLARVVEHGRAAGRRLRHRTRHREQQRAAGNSIRATHDPCEVTCGARRILDGRIRSRRI